MLYGLLINDNRIEAGAFGAETGASYRITIGYMVCVGRAVGSGAVTTLFGSIDYGGWTDPMTFSPSTFDVRTPIRSIC